MDRSGVDLWPLTSETKLAYDFTQANVPHVNPTTVRSPKGQKRPKLFVSLDFKFSPLSFVSRQGWGRKKENDHNDNQREHDGRS